MIKEYNLYRSYVVGVPGNYAVKAQGNNRVMVRDLPTIEAAEEWIKANRPMWGFRDISADISQEDWDAFLNELKRHGAIVKCTKG